jgi:hypothetical protein
MMTAMSFRARRYLLIVLLLLGQAGMWLHGLSHHIEPATATMSSDIEVVSGHTPNDPEEGADACLICLAAAAFGLALLSVGLAFAVPVLGFARPVSFFRRLVVRRDWSRSARGPPKFS